MLSGTSRRGLITGLISFVAAPAIVRATSIMPVKAMAPLWDNAIDYPPMFITWNPTSGVILKAALDETVGQWVFADSGLRL